MEPQDITVLVNKCRNKTVEIRSACQTLSKTFDTSSAVASS